MTDPHPWASALDTLFAHAWHRLVRGVHDRHAPARQPLWCCTCTWLPWTCCIWEPATGVPATKEPAAEQAESRYD
jgi:hypothetical protein